MLEAYNNTYYNNNTLRNILEGAECKMETVICRKCMNVMEYVEGEKVSVLYGTCHSCNQ